MKGISPLIAEVLLIGFVIAVGAIIATWVTGYTRTTTHNVNEQANKQMDCMYGNIQIITATYNHTTHNISGYVENKGSIPLGDVRLQVIYDNSTISDPILICNELDVGNMCPYNIEVNSNYAILRVSTNCTSPSVDDKLTKDEISTV